MVSFNIGAPVEYSCGVGILTSFPHYHQHRRCAALMLHTSSDLHLSSLNPVQRHSCLENAAEISIQIYGWVNKSVVM